MRHCHIVKSCVDSDYRPRFNNTMSNFLVNLADVDWFYVVQLYAFIFFSVLIGTLANGCSSFDILDLLSR